MDFTKMTFKKNNAFYGADFLNAVIGAYAKHPVTAKVEPWIADMVKHNGETKEMHMFYLSVIINVVEDIATTENLVLAFGSNTGMVDYAKWFEIDAIAHTIYQMRKNSLGLSTFNCTTKDMDFRAATERCETPIDYKLFESKVELIKELTIIQMHKLNLENWEVVLNCTGSWADTFTFYKILALVIKIGLEQELHKVNGVGLWAFYVAAFEIAHNIEDNYNRAEKEEKYNGE